ncbi:MAG: hypothetical protein LBI77_02215 [Puniceicoccales bacterium]|jgi:hypothetical protein|nr:hypothetical protein [Puniceicoccales bacterium]
MIKTSKIFILISLPWIAAGINFSMESKHSIADDENRRGDFQNPKTRGEIIGYEAIAIEDALWEEPKIAEKGENWTFDLFTSPTITREGDKFLATWPWLKERQITINFDVISIEKKVYPLQFGGYFSAPTVEGIPWVDGGYVFMLRDGNTRKTMTVKLGQKIGSHGVEVRNFKEKGPNGEIVSYPQLTLFDSKINREIILTPMLQYYDGLWDIKLRSKVDNGEILLSHGGENFSVGEEIYTLENINLKEKSLEFSQKMGKDNYTFFRSIGDGEKADPPDNKGKNLIK